MKLAKNIYFLEKKELTEDKIEEIKINIKNGDAYIVKSFFTDIPLLHEIRQYLTNIGNNSLPSYYPLEKGILDHHRIVQDDQRSYIKSIVHQYMFHPWNQNIYDFYNLFKEVYHLKNLLSSMEKDKWLCNNDFSSFVPRITFHHYPVGGGYLSHHSDPVSEHQLVVPILQMSNKGNDFKLGGLYAMGKNNKKVYIDDVCSIGDLFLFNAEVYHGVTAIDKEEKLDWLSDNGRWMLLCSTIKTNSNYSASDAINVGNING